MELGKLLERIPNFCQRGSRLCELKKHKPWFDEGCSQLSDQRKQAKLQYLQDPGKINADNLNIRC
jgi:hypothetical protein